MARRRSRKAPPPDPPSLREPVACVLLAIDPGRRGGWALFVRGVLLALGVARNAKDRAEAVRLAAGIASGEHIAAMPDGTPAEALPLVIVAEAWEAGGWKSHKQLLGMGAQWGRWAEQIELAGIPTSRILRVTPQRWRSRVIKARTKEAAVQYVTARWPGVVVETDDAAEAVCIGAWGRVSPVVAAAVPSRRRRGRP